MNDDYIERYGEDEDPYLRALAIHMFGVQFEDLDEESKKIVWQRKEKEHV